MQPLSVIIIGPAYPLRGGIADFDESLCRAFTEAGHSCEIVSFSLQYPGFLFPGKTQYDTSGSPPPGITIHTRINSVNPFNWIRTGNFIRDKKPDLVICRYWIPFMGPALGTILRRIRKNGKTKIIAVTDNVIPHEKRPGDRIFTSWFVKACDGFIAMSKAVLAQLSEFTDTPHKQFTVHPMYDIFGEKTDKQTARKKIGYADSDRLVLFFGFIRKYKGLDLLLEAMSDPRLEKLGVKLHVAGEFYEDRARYDALVQQFNLQQRVHMKGDFVAGDDVRYYFCACNLVTLTYRDATQSGVTGAAFQFDKPVLVTDVGGLAEIIPHGKAGYVVPVEPAAIADAIADYFENDREAAFTEGMMLEKPKFGWDVFVARVIGLYNELPPAKHKT